MQLILEIKDRTLPIASGQAVAIIEPVLDARLDYPAKICRALQK